MIRKQTHPSLRTLYRTLDPLLSDQRPSKVARKADSKQRLKDASKAALDNIKQKLKADAKGLSKADLLQRIVPIAGKKPWSFKKVKGKAKPSLNAFLLFKHSTAHRPHINQPPFVIKTSPPHGG